MAVIVRIPAPLRALTAGRAEVLLESPTTIPDAVDQLEARHAGLRDRLLDAQGVRKFINIYVGDEDILFLDGVRTKLVDGAEITIVPAIAGGAHPSGPS